MNLFYGGCFLCSGVAVAMALRAIGIDAVTKALPVLKPLC